MAASNLTITVTVPRVVVVDDRERANEVVTRLNDYLNREWGNLDPDDRNAIRLARDWLGPQ